MKIGLAFDTTFDSDAGVQQYFKSLGRYLIRKGHDVKFIVTQGSDRGEFKGRIISMGTVFNPPIINTTSVPFGLYTSVEKIQEVLKENNFDLIHVGLPVSPFSFSKLVRMARCPVVGTFMSYSNDSKHRFLFYLSEKILTNSAEHLDILIAPNRLTARDAARSINGKYHIIPNAIDMNPFKKKLKPIESLRDGRPVIFYLGRLDKRKGVKYLIKALPDILKKIPNVHLVIAGDGPLRGELEMLVALKNIKHAVDFVGYVDEEEKPRYYASADICVFPALYGESFGIVIVEALAAGKIPIAAANEGYRSVLENLPETLVPTKDSEALARRVIFYLTHSRQKKTLERRCRSEARSFDWLNVGPQIVSLYRQAVAKKY